MIITFIRSFLGPLSPLLDFVIENPGIITGILLLIVLVYVAGRFQQFRISTNTESLVLEKSKQLLQDKPHITSSGIFKKIYPTWEEQVSSWAYFIPSKNDFYPMLIKPAAVAEKLPFNAEKVAEILKAYQIPLDEFDQTQ
ncbi:MAG: hypothetical protein JEZ06_18435 [Anaerolineaceae bacterium]|nr:hypothetical protein [Anaerolineaceae bacterium]